MTATSLPQSGDDDGGDDADFLNNNDASLINNNLVASVSSNHYKRSQLPKSKFRVGKEISFTRLLATYAVNQYFTIIQQLRSRLWEVDILCLQADIRACVGHGDNNDNDAISRRFRSRSSSSSSLIPAETALEKLRQSISVAIRQVEEKIVEVKRELKERLGRLGTGKGDSLPAWKGWARLVLVRDNDVSEKTVKVVEEPWEFLQDSFVDFFGGEDAEGELTVEGRFEDQRIDPRVSGIGGDGDSIPNSGTPSNQFVRTGPESLPNREALSSSSLRRDVSLTGTTTTTDAECVENFEDSLVCVESAVSASFDVTSNSVCFGAGVSTSSTPPVDDPLLSRPASASSMNNIPIDSSLTEISGERRGARFAADTPSSTPRRGSLRGGKGVERVLCDI